MNKAGLSSPRLLLGTVQLGLPYGRDAANRQPDQDAARQILALAAKDAAGLDTAAAYGRSEQVIGICRQADMDIAALPVTTKIMPLPEEGDPQADKQAMIQSIRHSLNALHCQTLHGLMMHRWENWCRHDGMLRDILIEHRQSGQTSRIGVSLQSPEEARQAFDDPAITIVQLPCNLLDQRWHWIRAARHNRPDIEIHLRSIYLQGILLSPDATLWPAIPGMDNDALYHQLAGFVQKFDRSGADDLCLAWARAQDWADYLVIGCHHPDHFKRTAALFDRPELTAQECAEIEKTFAGLPETLLNPALWPPVGG